jgi:hypothetical protein
LDGLLLRGGEFVGGPVWDEEFERLLTETFRRLVLGALRKVRDSRRASTTSSSPGDTGEGSASTAAT